MSDPALNIRRNNIRHTRIGAVLPMFAVILPVLLILCGFAINLAYMQQVSTELKICTDAAAHAGGRAMSIHQTTDAAIAQAELTAQTNRVGGKILSIGAANQGEQDDIEVFFGNSIRSNNGYGMYQFAEVSKAQVDSGAARATSVAVNSQINLPLVFQAMNYDAFGGHMTNFDIRRRSIATQVDRDIALVLDRSGSMLWYKSETQLTSTLNTLYNTYDTVVTTPGYWKYGCYEWKSNKWKWKGYYALPVSSSWQVDMNDKIWTPEVTSQVRRISSTEKTNATKFLYDRTYTDNVIYQIERYLNPSHTLGTSFTSSEHPQLVSQMAQYVRDWRYQYNTKAPRYSLWYFLDKGVTAFLDVLEITDQNELVSLVSFASTSRVDLALQPTYSAIRTKVSSIFPNGGTAVGDGMLDGLPTIISGSASRPFAAKTILVLTDGDSNAGIDPVTAVQQIIGSNNVTIHTVTFTPEANQTAMQAVAAAGFGRHYHTDDGVELVDIFEEIANNLPTILTE